jgi:hypothetical protein
MIAHFLAALGPYTGYIVGVAGLAAVLLLNQVIFRRRWKSYPTLAQYLATHPECNKAEGVVCSHCGTVVARIGVSGRGSLHRCTWCETELYRIDRNGADAGA